MMRRAAAHRLVAATCLWLVAAPVRAQNTGPIVAEAVIDAPGDTVWAAWATGQGLRSWLAPHAEIDMRVGGLMRANYSPQGALGDSGTIENTVLSFDPGRMLSISVSRTPAGFPFPNAVTAMWTVIYFDQVDAMRTRVRVVGLGFSADDESQKMRAFFETGNRTTLERLAERFSPSAAPRAQASPGAALVAALREGGHVIVMRHARSPSQRPSQREAAAGNTDLERQLDSTGLATAAAMGDALRRLKIPVSEVLTSPTYRARQTARAAGLTAARAVEELGDGGQSMKAATDGQADWLRRKVSELPRGTNIILITHMPNIARAFPAAADVADGEALVFGSDGRGGARLAGRIRIEEWPSLR
jgi:phosphohistidine phosphatase SixA